MKLKIRSSGICLVLAAACLPATTASAEYIQFTFTGEVTEIGGALWDPWLDTQIGDPVTVQYIFDSNAEDHAGGSQAGLYYILDLTFAIGETYQIATFGRIIVDNDISYWGDDQYAVTFALGSEESGSFFFSGFDMFSSDALPTDLDWTQFATDHMGVMRFDADPMNRFLMYQFTSWNAEVVPGAPTLFVLLCGVIPKRKRRK